MVGYVKDFVVKFGNDWALNLAAMLAYNLMTTLVPIVLALLTVVGIVLQGDPAMIVSVQTSILNAVPGNLRHAIDLPAALLNLRRNTGLLGLLSFLGLLLAGTNLFGAVENAFSIIYRTRSRDILPQKIMSLGMLIIFLVLAPLMVGASSLINFIVGGAHTLIPVDTLVVRLAWQGVALVAAALLAFVLFLAVYIVVPNLPLSVRHAWRGALVAGILLPVINLIFPAYTTLFIGKPTNYGATAFLALVIIAWLWLFSTILVLGAEVNAYAMGMRATPGDLATEFHHDRVHTKGKDVPPAHQAPQVPSSTEQQADHLDRPPGEDTPTHKEETTEPEHSPGQLPAARGSPALARAAGACLGVLGQSLLLVSWLAYRALHRRAPPPRS